MVARSPQEIQALQAAWEGLSRAGEHTLFQSFTWNALAARAFADRATPFVVHVENGGGQAIIPACVQAGQVRFLGDELFDYRDMLWEGSEEALRRAWREVAALDRSFSLTALLGDSRGAAWDELGFAPSSFTSAPGVCGADVSASAFAAAHTRSGRLLRRLHRAGAELHLHSGRDARLVRHLYQCKAAQLQGRSNNLFADQRRVEFLVEAAASEACEIFTFETPGSLVAALLTFRDGPIRRFYTTYFDHRWAHHSPGTALLYEVTRRSLEHGLDCDYMTGEQPHKLRFATSSTPLFRVAAPPQVLRAVATERRELPLVA
ncbi:MAG: GNAT family N-acetyltransferase [Terriglobales bacterium]